MTSKHQVAEASVQYLVEAAGQTVPVGYKLTEAGVIPEDWEVTSIGQVFQLINGCAFKPTDWKQTGTPIIRIQNLNDLNAPFNYTQTSFPEKNRVEPGDLLFAWSGTIGSSFGARVWTGSSGVLNQHIFKVHINQDQITLNFALLVFGKIEEDIAKQAHGFKASFVHVKKSDLTKVNLPLPPLPEQRAIANALSDVDALINELEKLISKKQTIKTATMQQLLTGRTRLPAFALREDSTQKGYKQSELGKIPEDWEVVSLGDASQFINGRAYSLHEWETQGTPVIRLQNLTGRGEDYYYSNLQLPEKQYCGSGDLLFMWSATFGPVIWKGQRAIYHYHIWKIECREGYVKPYLYYLLDDMTEKLKRGSSSGGTMLHVTKEKMESTKSVFPQLKEQTAIATILSDMDTEIQTLQQRLSKTRQIKQGMMQELLTGRIRLVSGE